MHIFNLLQVSNTEALRLYRDKMEYRIERTISSYYVDNEDAHFLVRRGLQQLWQEACAEEPQLVGADEVHYQRAHMNVQDSSSSPTGSVERRKATENHQKLLT